jgi:tetratricopeptide (TPR) repeat protein
MSISLYTQPLPLEFGPQPETNFEEAKRLASVGLSPELSKAPSLLKEWVGREDLLELLNQDWIDPRTRIVGLIGFGGEGKSSIARHWIEQLLNTSSLPQPDGIFWWGFYEQRNVDAFLESALNYLSEGKISQASLPSSHAKANFLAAMLPKGRYLFVLDGIEVLQHQDGDEYGLLVSNDLLEFLNYFAATKHESLCIVTSRAPLYDFISYISYTHRDVNRLNEADGRALFYNLGVQEIDERDLTRLVNQWDGHALTLSLLATYLKQHQGNILQALIDLTPPGVDEEKYDRVRRLLRRYDEHLTVEERNFLTVFSAFRLPIQEAALKAIANLIEEYSNEFSNSSVSYTKDTSSLQTVIEHLLDYKIIRYNSRQQTYSNHPLIRSHYQECLFENKSYAQKVNKRISDFYLENIEEIPKRPTLTEILPLIEAVHHLCGAGEYDRAYYIWWEYICQRTAWVLERQLGASETELEILSEFFPNSDFSQKPLLSKPRDRNIVIRDVGHQMKNLGHLCEATPFYLRAVEQCLKDRDWYNACEGYKELASLYLCLGELENAAKYASGGLSFIDFVRSKNRASARLKLVLKARLGWIYYLLGKSSKAGRLFQEAEHIQRQITRSTRDKQKYLYGSSGMYHAIFLLRLNKIELAKDILQDNLEICERNSWKGEASWCHCVLGDLFARKGNHEIAQLHYDTALDIARNIYQKSALIGALLSRGLWEARYKRDAGAAFNDLQEALRHAERGGYRLYEVDTRIGLAWLHYITNNVNNAQTEAEQSQRMSEEMKYYLGKVDVDEVIKAIQSHSNIEVVNSNSELM